MFRACCLALFLLLPQIIFAQNQRELNSEWMCIRATGLNKPGDTISKTEFLISNWLPAIVPGTVLANQLFNKQIPDPFYGMNNEAIPDIYKIGKGYYTYWFACDFKEQFPADGSEVYLNFRGVNYSFDVWLNGHKLNEKPDEGMFLSSSYCITKYLEKSGTNRLAVIVYPPSPVGNPNNGQGGDGMIAHSVTNQFVAGWDWIQPVRDRNTGIWDKVFIKRVGQAHLDYPHVVTLVPGRRSPDGKQWPATIRVSAEVENTSDSTLKGVLEYELAGKRVSTTVTLEPHSLEEVTLPDLQLENPKLWWPNGYGTPYLYTLKMRLLVNRKVVDDDTVTFGVRQLATAWNAKTKSREIKVNGQKIFIKGGNWILPDELLRFSKERYDAEVRFHRDMNLNLIRVWGGGITERPEFYDACDKYGLMVMQDFWVSGDCNGRWYDPLKLEDTNARRNYPDNHNLFIASLEDQVKLLRNHPSLALWCGGNEIRPPADILTALRDSLLPQLDSTRYFFEFSNDDSMSLHGGDGPYTVQQLSYFWEHKSFPFNSEIGSVGIGNLESLEKFLPEGNRVVPYYSPQEKKWVIDSVWQYHRYMGYDSVIEAYGHASSLEEFATKAQLVNYGQYRALIEGATAKMWDWYTGIMIWKTQNPWTAMRGQMYDCYLDANACLFGVMEGSKPVHVMFDPIKKAALIANNLFKPTAKLELQATAYSYGGDEMPLASKYVQVPASNCAAGYALGAVLDSLLGGKGGLLSLKLIDSATNGTVDENTYWLPASGGSYTGLAKLPQASLEAATTITSPGVVEVKLSNPPNSPLAFFTVVSLVDPITKKRILPVFYSANYVSIARGGDTIIRMEYDAIAGLVPMVCVEGWNVKKQFINIKQ